MKAYGLNRQGESYKSKTKVLTCQPKQGGHLRIAKEELHDLEVDMQNLNSKVTKEDLQQLQHQRLNPSAITKEIGI